MAKVKLTKKETDRIMKIKGNVGGAIFGAYYKYLIAKKGEDAVKAVEKRLEEVGCPIKLKDYSSFGMYSLARACLLGLATLEYFGWDESKAFEIGYEAPMYSIVTKLLMKYVSIEKIITDGPEYWHRFFDFGELKCTKYDINKGYAILRLEGFKKFHPIVYGYMVGYLKRISEFGNKSQNVRVEQTKSLYNNDPYDEFKITW